MSTPPPDDNNNNDQHATTKSSNSIIFQFLTTEMISSLILLPYLCVPQELVRISRTCRKFREAVAHDAVWHQAAKTRYGDFIVALTKRYILNEAVAKAPPPTSSSSPEEEEEDEASANETPTPTTWKGIVAEDNRRIACPTLRMSPKACNWRTNDSDWRHNVSTGLFLLNNNDNNSNHLLRRRKFYCCIIEGVKWSRTAKPYHVVRVYINVRGERNLRPPKPYVFCSTEGGSSFTGYWNSALSEETPGHYKGCIAFCADNFERPGTYRFCYNTDFGDYEHTEIFTIPELEGIGYPTYDEVHDPSYSYPYLKHLFGLNDTSPFYSPAYSNKLFGPYRAQTPEEELDMFKKFVPMQFIERDQGMPNAWWV